MILIWRAGRSAGRGRALGGLARNASQMEAINVAAFALTFCWRWCSPRRCWRAGTVSLWDGFLYADSLSALVVSALLVRVPDLLGVRRRLFSRG